MHEASLALNIYEIAREEMKKHPACSLEKIFIDIGEFTHIDPEALTFAFEVMEKPEISNKTVLAINRIPLILGCKACKAEFSSKDMIFICPKCESKNIEVLKGREFRITELGISDP